MKATLQAAQGLPVLEDLHATARSEVFVGRRPDGLPVVVEVFRPLHLQESFNPDALEQPSILHVMEGTKEAPTGRGCAFILPDDAPVRRKLMRP